uniref:Uncharacterized protein n=1 Tax=Spermophilus dauricus TaxID=99837 RepID=A0A8C9PI76_SPEDA
VKLVQEAWELHCGAAKRCGCPRHPGPESTVLCLGQEADIWAYILQHVHSRSVKKIRGNLLWYGHQDSPEGKIPCYKIPFHPRKNLYIFCSRPCLVLDMLGSKGHKTALIPAFLGHQSRGSQKSTGVMAQLGVCPIKASEGRRGMGQIWRD